MKFHLTFVSSLFLSLAAFSGSPLALGDSIPFQPQALIASVSTSGGFTRVPDAFTRINIYQNGDVIWSATDEPTRLLAKLSTSSLQTLKNAAVGINPGRFVNADPQAPECADAPRISYTVTNKNGKQREISYVDNCKLYYAIDMNSGHIDNIRIMLDGFRSLSFLKY
jgi:hypothetical protein